MPLFTSLIICLSCIIICFSPSLGYRDGAREESCYNHSVVHDNAFSTNCGEGCRYFLTVKQVVNDSTLELGNETDSYECGKIYGSKLDTTQFSAYIIVSVDEKCGDFAYVAHEAYHVS